MSFLICYFNLLFLNIVFCLLWWCLNLRRNPKHQNVHLKGYDILEYPTTNTVVCLFISLILAYLLCCEVILYMTFISTQYDLCLLFLFALVISNIHLRDGICQYIMPSNSKEPGLDYSFVLHCTVTSQEIHPFYFQPFFVICLSFSKFIFIKNTNVWKKRMTGR